MLKQRDVDSLANLWPACLPGVHRTTKPTLANLWPACRCAWRAMHNQAHHESTPITIADERDDDARLAAVAFNKHIASGFAGLLTCGDGGFKCAELWLVGYIAMVVLVVLVAR